MPYDNRDKSASGERIAKAIARAGVASRRAAEALIAAGHVSVNGAAISSPALNVTAADRIVIDGKPLPQRERTRLFLYHKPRGQVTTHSDPQGRPTIFAAIPENLPRLLSVGRLDMNTEGLILLTNDGGLARVLELPATGWTRRYRVRAHGQVRQERLDGLRNGIAIDGIRYGAIEARLEREQGANVWLTFAMREGKNREVKNVLGHLGLAVNRLIRVSFGPFQLGDLPVGAVEEIPSRVLREQLGDRLVALAGADFSAPIVEREAASVQGGASYPPPRGEGRRARRQAGAVCAGLTALRAGVGSVEGSPHPQPLPSRSRIYPTSTKDERRTRVNPSSEGRGAPLHSRHGRHDDDAKTASAVKKNRRPHHERDPERLGEPELARREKRRGRRPRNKRR